MTDSIGIAEIFYSIQGEGYHTGKEAIFVRTAGCNLSCDFCDTNFSLKEKTSGENLIKKIKKYPCKFIVLTGGEPTLQHKALKPVIKNLQKDGYFIAMETNGTSLEIMGVDWVTVSPKISQGGEWFLKKGNELKIVYEEQDLTFYEESDFNHYYLQPKELRSEPWGNGTRLVLETKKEWEKTIEKVTENPLWKLSLQIHKELEIR